jgi:hypothetical protein
VADDFPEVGAKLRTADSRAKYRHKNVTVGPFFNAFQQPGRTIGIEVDNPMDVSSSLRFDRCEAIFLEELDSVFKPLFLCSYPPLHALGGQIEPSQEYMIKDIPIRHRAPLLRSAATTVALLSPVSQHMALPAGGDRPTHSRTTSCPLPSASNGMPVRGPLPDRRRKFVGIRRITVD